MSMLSPEGIQALIKFQKDVGPVTRDSVNGHFQNKYATLDTVIEAVTDTLVANDLAVIQRPMYDSLTNTSTLVTTLLYKDGSYIESISLLSPKESNNPQQMGSAITYARRYALLAILGLAPEDDDGNAASGVGNGGTSKPKSTPSAGKPQASPNKPASDKQLEYVTKLVSQKAGIIDPAKQDAYLREKYNVGFEGLSSFDASRIVESMKDMPAAAKQPNKAGF